MSRVLTLIVGVAALLSGAGTAASSSDNGPWLNALTTAFVILDLTAGDIDGDGKDETVLCYRQDIATTDQGSGIVILQGTGVSAKPVFHVQLEAALCQKVRVANKKLGILLAGNKQLTWSYGEEIRFKLDKQAAVPFKSVASSSTLDSAHGADKATDNDLSTSWAEGAPGTGIGQTLTLRLSKAVDLGALGIYCGEGSSPRSFFDRNRLHRGSIQTKTEADLGDSEAGVDFSALGIDSIGDRIEFSCENKPQVTYVPVRRSGVLEIQIRVDSVYLGDKKDDTHIAEVEVVAVLDSSRTLDRAKDIKKKAETEPMQAASKDATAADVDHDSATKQLDGDGRSIVSDDF